MDGDGDGDGADDETKAEPSAAPNGVFMHGRSGLTAGVAGAACAASSAMTFLGL